MAKNFINCEEDGRDGQRAEQKQRGWQRDERRNCRGEERREEGRKGKEGSAEISLGGNSRRLFVKKFIPTRRCATHRESRALHLLP